VRSDTGNTHQNPILLSNNLNCKQPIALEKLVLGILQLQVVLQDWTYCVIYNFRVVLWDQELIQRTEFDKASGSSRSHSFSGVVTLVQEASISSKTSSRQTLRVFGCTPSVALHNTALQSLVCFNASFMNHSTIQEFDSVWERS